MTAALVRVPESTSALEFSAEQTSMIRDMFCRGASDGEFGALLEVAKLRRLNPFKREIFFVKRWDGALGREVWSAITSIDGFRLVADRTGLYGGQDEPEWVTDGSKLVCAKVRVYRKDWGERACVGVAYYDEYVQLKKDKSLSGLWGKMPRTMLAKCAEALALRKAFPGELAGLYTGDELGQEVIEAKGEEAGLRAPLIVSARALRTDGSEPAMLPEADADDFPPSWQEPAAREPSPAPPPAKAAQHTTKKAATKAAPSPAAPPPPTPQLDDEAARLRAHLEQACLGLPDKFEYRGTERTRADFRKSALEKCGADVGLLRSVVNTVWGLRGDAHAELDRLGAKLGPAWASTVEKLKKGPMAHAMLKLGEALAIATYERRIVKALEEDGDVEALLSEASADMRLSAWGLDQVGQMARPKAVGVDPERAAIVAEGEVNEKTWPKIERPVWDGIVGGSKHES